jgi:ribosomal protein S14
MNREMQWKLLDYHRRKQFLKAELRYLFFKNVLFNSRIPLLYRYLAFYKKTQISRITSATRIQNRCVKTGRIWGINKHTRYSRFFFRVETNNGYLPGFKRASW